MEANQSLLEKLWVAGEPPAITIPKNGKSSMDKVRKMIKELGKIRGDEINKKQCKVVIAILEGTMWGKRRFFTKAVTLLGEIMNGSKLNEAERKKAEEIYTNCKFNTGAMIRDVRECFVC